MSRHDDQTCRYRPLYEGSQRTLADMATKQADALSRVGRIRAQLIQVVRRTYPRLFVQQEREIGVRFSELTDEILVSYVEKFMQNAETIDPGLLEELRIALQHAGIPVPSSGFDLDAWIAAVRMPRPATGVPDAPAVDAGDVDTAAPTQVVPAENDLNDLFGDPGPSEPGYDEHEFNGELEQLFDHPDLEPPPEPALPGRSAPEPTPGPPPSWPGAGAMKPTLFPTQAPPKTRRRRRTTAIPGTVVPDVPGAEPVAPAVTVTDELRNQLLAASALPYPVFTSDLAALVGDSEAVDAWQRERQQGDLTVRFVLPKPRHRQRGALVVPQGWLKTASAETTRSLWVACLQRFRGAKLYELGVFFHRFREQVVSHQIDDDVVVARLSLPHGIVGVVLVLGATLKEGGRARAAVAHAIEGFLSERLTQVAVLATNTDRMQPIEELVAQEARTRNWQASMPVTLSLSWEYTDGTGVARPLLGN